MALSMTGYGRGMRVASEYTVTVEIKSLNHRYLETYFKIPRKFSFLEDRLRRELTGKVNRGKLEVLVTIERKEHEETKVELNHALVRSYLQAMKEIQQEYQVQGATDLQTIVTLPDVFKVSEAVTDEEALTGLVAGVMEEALDALITARRKEGEGLCRDLAGKLVTLEEYRKRLLQSAPQVVHNYQERLTRRVQELTGGLELDPGRLATEVALFAEKSDINEELVRIESHLHQFGEILKVDTPVGRRLDFIVQELHREINTVGSKSVDLKNTQVVLDFKTELEKIREQVQNIE